MKAVHLMLGVAVPVLAAATLLAPGVAQGQGFNTQQLNPMPGQKLHFIGQPSARPNLDKSWEVGLFGNYADDSLVVENSAGDRLGSLVGAQLTANLLLSLGIVEWLDVGLDVPLIIFQEGDAIPQLPGVDGTTASFGLGDIRLVPRLVLYSQETKDDRDGFSLALLGHLYFPTGDTDSFQGGEFRAEPQLVADVAITEDVRLSANVGYSVRPEVTIANLTIDDTVNFGAAADFGVGGDVHIVPEISVKAVATGAGEEAELPTEGVLGLKYLGVKGLLLEAGGGVGLVSGFGTPDFRVFGGLAYTPETDEDPDKDGILGENDKCPNEPEDLDTFEDEDGCPDPDNDKDGIADTNDNCPLEAEDVDTFEDADGCPDPDNDKDGVADGDDKCPAEPEDQDGYKDEDGCPDPDNDGDKILDTDDKCPNEAEDMDGWEDTDGCPDPDNDNDNILDVEDKCPNEAEVVNGVDDEDGCPDEGGLVEVDCDKINIKEKVFFNTGKATIQKKSFALLDAVASVLKAQDRIKKVRVEGHTDDVGNDKSNEKLSDERARSVMKYLTDKGVKKSRLEAKGFGEKNPTEKITDDKGKKLRGKALKAARSANRRVEFVIAEQDECKEVIRSGKVEPEEPKKKVRTLKDRKKKVEEDKKKKEDAKKKAGKKAGKKKGAKKKAAKKGAKKGAKKKPAAKKTN